MVTTAIKVKLPAARDGGSYNAKHKLRRVEGRYRSKVALVDYFMDVRMKTVVAAAVAGGRL